MQCRVSAFAVAVALALPLAAREEAPSPAPASPAPPTFAERMTIRETEILVERPPGRRMPRASDLKVLIDGKRHTAERVEEAGDDSPWHLVLYLDPELAGPGTRFSSLLALAAQAETLTRLGTVEVLQAGSPLPLVEPTRDPRAILFALGDLAGKARLDRDLEERQRFGSDEPQRRRKEKLTLETASQRLDRLVARLAARRPTGPHALFLIAEGADPELAPPFERAARLLAGYAWVTFPVLVRKERTKTDVFAGQTEIEILRQSGGGGSKNNLSMPPLLPTRAAAPTTLSIEGVVELLFDPEVAGFRALAKETAGTVIGREAQLAPALDRLGRRMRVWIDETEPHGRGTKEENEEKQGRLRKLEVARIKSEQTLRASTYLRASTPEEMTATRLRVLLAGEELEGNFKVDAGWEGGSTLRLRFEKPRPREEDGEEEAGPVRVTWGWLKKDGELTTGSRLYSRQEVEAMGGRFDRSLPLEGAPGIGAVAVVVDDLARERWGGARVR